MKIFSERLRIVNERAVFAPERMIETGGERKRGEKEGRRKLKGGLDGRRSRQFRPQTPGENGHAAQRKTKKNENRAFHSSSTKHEQALNATKGS